MTLLHLSPHVLWALMPAGYSSPRHQDPTGRSSPHGWYLSCSVAAAAAHHLLCLLRILNLSLLALSQHLVLVATAQKSQKPNLFFVRYIAPNRKEPRTTISQTQHLLQATKQTDTRVKLGMQGLVSHLGETGKPVVTSSLCSRQYMSGNKIMSQRPI